MVTGYDAAHFRFVRRCLKEAEEERQAAEDEAQEAAHNRQLEEERIAEERAEAARAEALRVEAERAEAVRADAERTRMEAEERRQELESLVDTLEILGEVTTTKFATLLSLMQKRLQGGHLSATEKKRLKKLFKDLLNDFPCKLCELYQKLNF